MALRDDLLPYLTKEEIKKMVKNLAKEINRDYAGLEVILICPLKGSVHFCADLMRELEIPVRVDFVYLQPVRVRSEDFEDSSSPFSAGGSAKPKRSSSVKIVKDINIDLMEKHVLIVEEIIDNGRTLSFLRERLGSANPASIKIVTLLDKPSQRDLPLRPDYVGRTIDDRFVVGYGMDSEEMGRNYSDIFFLKN